jgi:ethanolamine ammonia-lyase small subunit
MSDDIEIVPPDPWQPLRRYTNARIGLGRAGDSPPTAALLAFQLDHAQARDAVHAALDTATLGQELAAHTDAVLLIHSAAADRTTYLKRPDLGRALSPAARATLSAYAAQAQAGYDAVFVLADGLSALAVQRNAVALLALASAALRDQGWRLGPVVVVEQGRVAIGDEIGAILRADQVAVLIGERPGLSVADSLGVYLTYGPRLGRSDAERNCISNIHAHGLSAAAASQSLVYLMAEARQRKLTGVALKDTRERQLDDSPPPPRLGRAEQDG